MGHELEPEIAAAFDIWPVSLRYWRAFHVLSDSRPIALGMGGGVALGIPFSEMASYATHCGFADDLEDFVGILQGMDAVFLEHANRAPGAPASGGAGIGG